jgi:hypothetical protein
MATEIESLIKRFRDGELSLDQLADTFATYPFKKRTEVPLGSENAYVELLEKVGTPAEKGTWEELEEAEARGLLTHEEYQVILRRRLDTSNK